MVNAAERGIRPAVTIAIFAVRCGRRVSAAGGAPRETRTPDPLITNQMLYQLSYRGAGRRAVTSCRVTGTL